jgi:hypothetical protein
MKTKRTGPEPETSFVDRWSGSMRLADRSDALVGFLTVAPPDTGAFRFAASLPMADLEDAMQAAAARSCGARFVATRNTRDFTPSPIPALTPLEALEQLGGPIR